MTLGEKLPVWLDCDTGNDDSFAILLAALHPLYNLVGISTCYGNAPLESTTHNTLAILEVLGFKQDDIKVYAGSAKPLEIPPRYATDVHGEQGLQGVEFPKKIGIASSDDMTYLEAIKQAVLEYKGKLNIVATGALTNIAKFVTTYPELKSKINYVSCMGGGIDIGNMSPYAEFNVHCDPKAAEIVLGDSSLKNVMVPLNITHRAIASDKIIKSFLTAEKGEQESIARKIFFSIILTFSDVYEECEGFTDGPPIHDPLTLFVLTSLINEQEGNGDSHNLEYLRGDIKVITDPKDVREGQTILTEGNGSSGVFVAMNIDIPSFWLFISEALDISDKHQPDHEVKYKLI